MEIYANIVNITIRKFGGKRIDIIVEIKKNANNTCVSYLYELDPMYIMPIFNIQLTNIVMCPFNLTFLNNKCCKLNSAIILAII